MKNTLIALGLGLLASVGASAQTDSLPETPLTLQHYTADEIKAQKLRNSHKIVYVGDDTDLASADSVNYILDRFYYDQYRHFKDPLAPYFLLMSKDAKLAMGIGGCVRMRGWYDFDGAMPVNGFTPYMIPVPSDPSLRRRLGGTPDGTSIFMRVIGRNPLLGDIVGYIQGNFQNDGHGFKLKQAYVEIRDWTIGYNTTTLKDPDAEVPVIDGAGQNGLTGSTAILIRWLHTFKNQRWSMAAALEMPDSQTDCDGISTKAIDDWFPDVAVWGQYNLPHNGHVRLTGLLRVIPYRDLVTSKNRSRFGWALQASGVWNPCNRLTLYAECNTGQGYQSTMGDLSIGNYDLVADTGTPGRLYAPWAMGLNAGVKYNFRDNLYACLALGDVRYFPRNGVAPTDYKYGMYGAVNLFYEPTPRLQVGIEYLIGSRHNFNRQHNHANRIDALFQFSF